jgi:ribosomal protein S27AE
MEWHCFKDLSRMLEADIQLEDLEDHHKFYHKGLKCPDCGLSFLLMDWCCFKDNVKMVDADIKLTYQATPKNQHTAYQKGKKCPVCGLSFFMENLVVGRIATAERMLEGK